MELSKERGVTLLAETTLAGVSMSERLSHSFARANSDCSCADCLEARKSVKMEKRSPG